MEPDLDSATHCERDDSPENCGIEITPAAMEEFERLFRDWQMAFPVCDQLAIGATPDLAPLARAALEWGKRVA
jgi:hypothetical protein